MNDDCLNNIITNLKQLGVHLNSINISENENITEQSMENLLIYLSSINLEFLNLYKTSISEKSYIDFFSSASLNSLKKLSFSFHTSNTDEMSEHSFFKELGKFIKNNETLQELKIYGYITAKDSYNIFSNLITNSSLLKLELISDHSIRYQDPDPFIDSKIQEMYDDLFDELYKVLMNGTCKLHTLLYPLMTEIFVYSNKGIEKYSIIEEKLNLNKKLVSK